MKYPSFSANLFITLSLCIFSKILIGQDYRGQDISAMNLSGMDLSAAQFDQTTVFSSLDPYTGQYQGVNLSGTNVILSGMAGPVDFRAVNLAGVSFIYSDLSSAQFDQSTVFSDGANGVNLSGTNAVLSNLYGIVMFGGANLSGVSFQNSDLSGAMFTIDTIFSQPDPVTGQISAVDLSDTNALIALAGAIDFREVNLSGANLTSSDLSSALLTGAIFNNSTSWPNGFDPISAGAINTDANTVLSGGTSGTDDNNTVFVVSGGDFNAPFYNFTYESNGSSVDFQSTSLKKGNTYIFKANYISPYHPFKIGEAFQVTSPYATGGQLDQNSAANNQSITVSIPSDYQGVLAYYCTVHSNMVSQFILSEPTISSNQGNQSSFIAIYQLDVAHIAELTTSPNSFAGNYSIVEELNANNVMEIRIRPMVDTGGGNWENLGANQYYYTKAAYSTLASIDSYLASQSIQPINLSVLASSYQSSSGSYQITDTDGDGVADNADAFPSDPTETADTDGDGMGDNGDSHPNDAGTGWTGERTHQSQTFFVGPGSDLSDLNLEGMDLSGANLHGAILDGARLRFVDFTEADLRGASLQWSATGWGNGGAVNLDNATLTDALLDGIITNQGDVISFVIHGLPSGYALVDANHIVEVDTDGDGIVDNSDADDDNDGVPDVSDAFPLDATETADTDGDGAGDNSDAFPSDPTETADTDGDGMGDNGDSHPNDPGTGWTGERTHQSQTFFVGPGSDLSDLNLEGMDLSGANLHGAILDGARLRFVDFTEADLRGASLQWSATGWGNGGAVNLDNATLTDALLDGIITNQGDVISFVIHGLPSGYALVDANHIVEVDTDGDGIVDNSDADDDNDGVPDVSDAFPLDATETADTDGDGAGDNSDAFPSDPTETADTDGDGVGDNADGDPNDPNVVSGYQSDTSGYQSVVSGYQSASSGYQSVVSGYQSDTSGFQSSFIAVYQLDASHISELTTGLNPITGNFSIVEELNAINEMEIRIRLMVDTGGGNWENLGANQFYYTKPAYSAMASIDSYLASQSIQPINSSVLTSSYQSSSGSYQSVVGGYQSDTSGYQSVVGGYQSDTSGYQTVVSGYQPDSSGYQSDISGYQSDTSGYQTVVGGYQSDSSGYQSDISGYQTDVSGYQSDTSGYQSVASGYQSDSSGYQSVVSGYQSDSSGYQSVVGGYQSDSSGYQTDVVDYVPGPPEPEPLSYTLTVTNSLPSNGNRQNWAILYISLRDTTGVYYEFTNAEGSSHLRPGVDEPENALTNTNNTTYWHSWLDNETQTTNSGWWKTVFIPPSQYSGELEVYIRLIKFYAGGTVVITDSNENVVFTYTSDADSPANDWSDLILNVNSAFNTSSLNSFTSGYQTGISGYQSDSSGYQTGISGYQSDSSGYQSSTEGDPGDWGVVGMTWNVYQVSNQEDLDVIKDPGHVEQYGFGPFPIQVALFQDGPMWRIQKVTSIGPGPDGEPGTPDDEFGDAGWVMSTNQAELSDGQAPIAVDQYFSERFPIFPHIGSYVIGSVGPPELIGPFEPYDPETEMNWMVYEIYNQASLDLIRDPNHFEPYGFGSFPMRVALFQEGPMWMIVKVVDIGPGPDLVPGTPDDEHGSSAWFMGTNQAVLSDGLAPIAVDQFFSDHPAEFTHVGSYIPGTVGPPEPIGPFEPYDPETEMNWMVYEIYNQASLDLIRDPNHFEPYGFGSFPMRVALFQEGPMWRIVKVVDIGPGPDLVPGTPDDEHGSSAWFMGTNQAVLSDGMAPIAVDQFFSEHPAEFTHVGSYVPGTVGPPEPIGPFEPYDPETEMNWMVYEIYNQASLDLIRDPNHFEPYGFGSFPMRVALFQEGPMWMIVKVVDIGPGPDLVPGTPDDEHGSSAWFMGTNQAVLSDGLAPIAVDQFFSEHPAEFTHVGSYVPGTVGPPEPIGPFEPYDPETEMNWMVYEIYNQASLDLIRDPNHFEPYGFGSFPMRVALFQEGPMWRIVKVVDIGPGPDLVPGTPDDEHGSSAWFMGTNQAVLSDGLAPIAVDQFFSEHPAEFTHVGSYVPGTVGPPEPIGPFEPYDPETEMNWMVYEIYNQASLDLIRDPNHFEPYGFGSFPMRVALFQEGPMWMIVKVVDIGPGPDLVPGTPDDEHGSSAWFMGTNQAVLSDGLAPIAVDQFFSEHPAEFTHVGSYVPGTVGPPEPIGPFEPYDPEAEMNWMVYEIYNQASLDLIRDPNHFEPYGFGSFPMRVALFQEGPMWRIVKVVDIGPGPDLVPGTPDDEHGSSAWFMGTNQAVLSDGLAPIAVDQFFSEHPAEFTHVGSYVPGTVGPPEPIGPFEPYDPEAEMNWMVYEIYNQASLDLIRDPNHFEPYGFGSFPMRVALFQEGPMWMIVKVVDIGPGPDLVPGTPDDEHGSSAWFMGTNQAVLSDGLAPIAVDQFFSEHPAEFTHVGSYVPGTVGPPEPIGPFEPYDPETEMNWMVYEIYNQASLDLIRDPNHFEPYGFGSFPMRVALFQEGPMWTIVKVVDIGPGPDMVPGTPDDEHGSSAWFMGTNQDVLSDGLAPIAVDQFFSEHPAEFTHVGSYVPGTVGPPEPIGPFEPYDPETEMNWMVYEIYNQASLDLIRDPNHFEPYGFGSFPMRVALFQEGPMWTIVKVVDIGPGPDLVPGTPDDEHGSSAWFMGTNQAVLSDGLAPIAVDQFFSEHPAEFTHVGSYVPGTVGPPEPIGPFEPYDPETEMNWMVYEIYNQASLDLIRDPNHFEPYGFGSFPMRVALFQEGPMWTIVKVVDIGPGPDMVPGTPDDEHGSSAWFMGTNQAVLSDGLAPIAVDQFFSDRPAEFTHVGSYVPGTVGPAEPSYDNDSMLIPIFALTAEQASQLTDGAAHFAGTYAFKDILDYTTNTEFRILFEVDEIGGEWNRVMDPNGFIFDFPISQAMFPHSWALDDFFIRERLQPIDFIHDEFTDPGIIFEEEILLPIVRTLDSPQDMNYHGISLHAEILDNGNGNIFEKGFLISKSYRFDRPDRVPSIDSFAANERFEVDLNYLEPGKTYYYRSYAMNEAGEMLGNIKKLTVPDVDFFHNPWEMAPMQEGGWRYSHWFGSYLLMENDWMYHDQLGWIFTSSDHFEGHWIWIETHGWLWTQESTWPFLFSHETRNWLYFIKSMDGVPIFFNYHHNQYDYHGMGLNY